MDSSREDLPRVSVDTVQDWQRFKVNYKQAAISKLEEQILANDLTAQRDNLLAHMNQYLDRTFVIAQPNLRVNGHNFESLDQSDTDMEPFDETLDRRVWSLADTRLQWHKRIAETRRNAPIDIQNALQEAVDQHLAMDAEELTAVIAEITQDKQVDFDSDRFLQCHEHIGNDFQKTLALSEELNQIIPTQGERSERAKLVATEIRTLKH